MYRNRYHTYPKTYADFGKSLELAAEYKKLAAAKGWAQGTHWIPMTGEGYEIIGDFDYPDLATYQREGESQEGDPDWAEFWRKVDVVEMTRPPYSELLETLTIG